MVLESPRSPSSMPVSEPHVVFLESTRSPSPMPVSDRGALSQPPTSPPETLEERRQFQEVLASITPLEMLGWEAVPPFHAAPLLSHTIHIQGLREQVSGGGATYEELARQLRRLLNENILRALRLHGNAGIVRQVVVNELSIFLNILLEPTFLAALDYLQSYLKLLTADVETVFRVCTLAPCKH